MRELRPVLLIVDSDEQLVKTYKERFEKEKFIVEAERSGDCALKKITQEMPDAVLLDVMIADKDGIEVLQIIKSNPVYKQIPVILYTNNPKDELRRLATNAGAECFLTKTELINMDIVSKVKNMIGWQGR